LTNNGSIAMGRPFDGAGKPTARQMLVIDDNPSVGAAIQTILARQGYDTTIAADAEAGIRAFDTSTFDVVMIDIFMPGTDGLELIKQFHDRSPASPIVAMSGFRFREAMAPTPDFLAMAAKFGATECLRKPFTPQQLVAAIHSCLHSVRQGDHAAAGREPEQESTR
jgi:DNA-binding NtrC family response regulator